MRMEGQGGEDGRSGRRMEGQGGEDGRSGR